MRYEDTYRYLVDQKDVMKAENGRSIDRLVRMKYRNTPQLLYVNSKTIRVLLWNYDPNFVSL